VALSSFPLTANGKVDRRALPEPVLGSEVPQSRLPRDAFEKKLAGIWAAVLHIGREQIGLDSDFFELGGHSLRATALVSHIHKHFHLSLPLAEIFNRPVLADMALYIKEADMTGVRAGDTYAAIQPVEKREAYPLSAVQRRLYFLQQVEPESTGYNVSMVLEVSGDLDKNRLENAFRGFIGRHESVRTAFVLREKEPVQRVADQLEFQIEYYEATVREFVRPFDLSRPPLLRVGLIHTPDKYVLMIDMHHIVSDGTTLNILVNELKHFYEGKALPRHRCQYKDFACWQRGRFQDEEIRRQEAYWLETFAGELPVLNLPTDFPRGVYQDTAGKACVCGSSRATAAAAEKLSKASGATLFMILLTAYNALLLRYTGADDVIVGTLTAGRPHSDLEQMVGAFITTLAMRAFPGGEKRFADFLQEVKENSLAAFSNQEYPFEELYEKIRVNRALNRNPLFDTMLILQNMEQGGFSLEGLTFRPCAAGSQIANFDLEISGIEIRQEIHFKIVYAAGIFKPTTVERLGRHLICILDDAVHHPQKPLKSLDMLTPPEKHQLLETFNDTAEPFPEGPVHRFFEEQARKVPDNTVVIFEGRSLTYRRLARAVDHCARRLKERGVVGGQLVGLLTGRSPEMLVAILGILASGAAYLPLEPSLPLKRLQHILGQTEVRLLVSHRPLQGMAERLITPQNPYSILLYGDEVLRETLDTGEAHFHAGESAADASALIYIIFTSGTTGTAKGIQTSHRNVAAYIHAFCRLFSLTRTDRTLQQASTAFDGFVEETFAIFAVGGGVVVPTDEAVKDPAALRSLIVRQRVTILSCSPLMLNELNKMAPLISVHTFLSSSDILRKEHYDRIVTYAEVYNMYGPTEATVCSTCYRCSGEEGGNIPVGKPIANYRVVILDGWLNPVPLGVPGEIYIGGAGISGGYFNQEKLTAEKFIEDPFHPGERLYRSGDSGRWLEDGNIEFFGRIDHQVKIRGYRVEPGEIESRLMQHPVVAEAVVLDRQDDTGDTYLCAYLVAREPDDSRLTVSALRGYLLEYLPDYMVPAFYVTLAAIPMTTNGKVDRRRLPEPTVGARRGQSYEAPADEQEQLLVRLWAELLGLEAETIGVNDHFFEIGGHSLKGMSLIARLHQVFHVDIPLTAIFRHPTVRDLAHYIRQSRRTLYREIPVSARQEYYPVSATQRRLYILSHLQRADQLGYNMPFGFVLEGDLDRQRLLQVLTQLIARHEVFRTSFLSLSADEEERLLVQRVHAPGDVPFVLESYRADAPKSNLEEMVFAAFKRFVRPFDLHRPPLLRAGLLELEPRRNLLMIDMHHIISDGSSTPIFSREFSRLFQGESLPPLRLQYRDFAVWQQRLSRSGLMGQKQEYWQDVFTGDIPVLDLPCDYPRPPVQDFSGDSLTIEAGAELRRALRELEQKSGATLFMTLLAVHSVVMMKYSGKEDMAIGTLTAGRPHAGLDALIGAFITTLALRTRPRKDKRFIDFLGEVKRHCLDAFENQDFPYESLLESLNIKRSRDRNPLFDTMLQVQNMEYSRVAIPGITVKPFEPRRETADFDLELLAAEAPDRLYLTIEYQTALFKRATIEQLGRHYLAVISDCTAHPGKTLAEIDMFADGEEQVFPAAADRPPPAAVLGSGVDYVPPRSETEKTIAREWAAVLGIEAGSIGLMNDFFDLGGNSVKALRLVSSSRFRFAILDIFNHSTVAELAAWIEQGDTSHAGHRQLLVPLTPGASSPALSLICIPYAGGTAAVYRPLADALAKHSAAVGVYGLSLPGHRFHDDEAELKESDIYTIARQCVEEIKQAIPTPVVLWGHCAGSALAVELGRLLEQDALPLEAVCIGADLVMSADQAAALRFEVDPAKYRFEDGEPLSAQEQAFRERIFRHDSDMALAYFMARLEAGAGERLAAPVYNIIAADDPTTTAYKTAYRNWLQFASTVKLITLAHGGHYFIKQAPHATAALLLDLLPTMNLSK
jgi:amino acid adenylation domain-containing protein